MLPPRLAGFGGKGIRTPDFQLAKLALYQLSYAPAPKNIEKITCSRLMSELPNVEADDNRLPERYQIAITSGLPIGDFKKLFSSFPDSNFLQLLSRRDHQTNRQTNECADAVDHYITRCRRARWHERLMKFVRRREDCADNPYARG